MKRGSSLIAALALALGSSTAAVAATDAEAFLRMTQSEYFLMIRDGHLAWERGDGAGAERQLVRAACAGDKDSQFMLGTMYLNGEGVPADALKAYAWYSAAAEVGDARYIKSKDTLAELIPAQYREAARAEAERMLDAYGLDATGQTCQMESITGSRTKDRVCRPRLVSGFGAIQFDVRQCEGQESARLSLLAGGN